MTTCPLTGAATRNEVITTLRMVEQYHPTNQTMHKVSENTFAPLIDEEQRKRHHMPRVIIFCQRYDNCAALYETFLIALGNKFTEPVGAPNVTPFLLVDMYTSPTH